MIKKVWCKCSETPFPIEISIHLVMTYKRHIVLSIIFATVENEEKLPEVTNWNVIKALKLFVSVQHPSRTSLSKSFLYLRCKWQKGRQQLLAEIPVREHQRSHQSPEIEAQADPAGADLHPDGWHAGLHGVVVSIRPRESQETVSTGREASLFKV